MELAHGFSSISVNGLSSSLERSLSLQPLIGIEYGRLGLPKRGSKSSRHQRIRNTLRKHERKDLVADYRFVSTVLEKQHQVQQVPRWRLDGDIARLRNLQKELQSSRSLKERIAAVDRCPEVQAIFGTAQSPLAMFCLRELSEYDKYLIKCLVASGQEHVMDWTQPISQEQIVTGTDLLKGTFHLMGQLIQVCNDVKSLQTWPSGIAGLNMLASNKRGREQEEFRLSLKGFLQVLDAMEKFYDCIGGIVGYQLTALELIKSSEVGAASCVNGKEIQETFYHIPEGKDLSRDTAFATKAAAWGINGLPYMGEIYPVGGAGDRLGLVDDVTGECLPVAMLPYCGRTLLEGHIRDLQAREYLYFKIHKQQVATPLAIMTSAAKKNNKRVHALLESRGWFGRPRENFKLFEQPLVPTVGAEDGHWLVGEPLKPVLKPGGHGVIWKLARDKGVFSWFYSKGRKAAVVRQISNPVAATDTTLLALAGVGLHHKKKFGFASCDRNVGAAEGVNVLMESKAKDGLWRYGTSCIEYTEFNKLGIPDVPVSTGSMQAKFPANTNVLYVDLKSVEAVAASSSPASLPGMIMNLKKPIIYRDVNGVDQSVRAGRLECTMQNIADSLQKQYLRRLAPIPQEELDTYIVFNKRRKVTSSAKRRRKAGEQSLHQTPDGSFLDITRNAYELFTSCGVEMDRMEGHHCYIDTGPPFIVLFHPALGPIWDVIRQKVRGGSISNGSDVQLEIAELQWQDVHVNGSLVVEAENIMGSCRPRHDGQRVLVYGEGCGKCSLKRVRVINKGIDWTCPTNVYWQNKVKRQESLRIMLKGNSEFDAEDVVFEGSHTFVVPDGCRMVVRSSTSGLSCTLEPLVAAWTWNYLMEDDGEIKLSVSELNTVV